MFVALCALAAAAPAFAQEAAPAEAATVSAPSVAAPSVAAPAAVTPAAREFLFSADGARLGRVELVQGAGVWVYLRSRAVTVPLASLSRLEDRLVTSLSAAEVRALR